MNINKLPGDVSEEAKSNRKRDDEESGNVSEKYDEGEVGFESKSFGAQASKFQTQPNKKKNKVIIVDDEEEKEFGVNTSINNHISLGSI